MCHERRALAINALRGVCVRGERTEGREAEANVESARRLEHRDEPVSSLRLRYNRRAAAVRITFRLARVRAPQPSGSDSRHAVHGVTSN
jgi:hypothetical protein